MKVVILFYLLVVFLMMYLNFRMLLVVCIMVLKW